MSRSFSYFPPSPNNVVFAYGTVTSSGCNLSGWQVGRKPQSVEAQTDDLLWGDLRPHRVIFVARERELLKCAENKSFPMTGPTLGAGGEIGSGWRTRGTQTEKDAKMQNHAEASVAALGKR